MTVHALCRLEQWTDSRGSPARSDLLGARGIFRIGLRHQDATLNVGFARPIIVLIAHDFTGVLEAVARSAISL